MRTLLLSAAALVSMVAFPAAGTTASAPDASARGSESQLRCICQQRDCICNYVGQDQYGNAIY